MAMYTRNCRICGKPYQVCSGAEKYDGVFRWQVVACSPECGAVYFERCIAPQNDVGSVDDPDEKEEKE